MRRTLAADREVGGPADNSRHVGGVAEPVETIKAAGYPMTRVVGNADAGEGKVRVV